MLMHSFHFLVVTDPDWLVWPLLALAILGGILGPIFLLSLVWYRRQKDLRK